MAYLLMATWFRKHPFSCFSYFFNVNITQMLMKKKEQYFYYLWAQASAKNFERVIFTSRLTLSYLRSLFNWHGLVFFSFDYFYLPYCLRFSGTSKESTHASNYSLLLSINKLFIVKERFFFWISNGQGKLPLQGYFFQGLSVKFNSNV